jgi:hypothetical protein
VTPEEPGPKSMKRPGGSFDLRQALQAFLKLLRKLTVFFFSSGSLLSARRFTSSYLGD